MYPMPAPATEHPLRQLWVLFLAITAVIAGAVWVSSDSPTAAPPWMLPAAMLAILGIVSYGVISDLSPRGRLAFVLFTASAIILATASVALAQASSGVVAPTQSTVITIDALTLSFLVGSVMPLLTALATKLHASSFVKGVMNLVLCMLGGVLVAFQTNHGSLTIQEIAAAAIATYVSAQSLYVGVLQKPAAAIAGAVPNTGVG